MLHADATENTPSEKHEPGHSPGSKKHQFAKPGAGRQPHGGRKPGPNKITRVLKEAILLAAETVGSDGRGRDGLVGFLIAEASKPKNQAFMNLLGRVLPATLKSGNGNNFRHHVTVEFVSAKQTNDDAARRRTIDVTPSNHKLEKL